MGILIKEMLNPITLHVLTSNPNPAMIREKHVLQATKELVQTVKLLDLYPNHQALINKFELIQRNYPSIYSHRTFFIWQMSQMAFQFMSLNLPSLDFLLSNSLKCQLAFETVLFDDICDVSHDKAIFHKGLLALKGEISQSESDLYQLIADTWVILQNEIIKTPNYTVLKSILDEGYQYWIASFEYSLAIQEESFRFAEKWEKQLSIIAHSTAIYLGGLIDLLFVPNLSPDQITSAKKVFLLTQKMVQIANWVTTWERELNQQDFTSGIFAIALQNNWISWDDLKNGAIDKVKYQIRNSQIEKDLWNEWERLRVESHQIVNETNLPALNGYIDGFSVLMFLQVASTGLV